MRLISTLLVFALPTFAAADTDRGAQGGAVAEVVTFRLVDGADTAAFLSAAKDMEPFLRSTGAVVRRTLSRHADGDWTDHIIWTSMDAAQSAAAAMMDRPEATPFMALIDPEGVVMRHEPVLLKME